MGSAVHGGGSSVLGLPLGCNPILPSPCFSSWGITTPLPNASLIFLSYFLISGSGKHEGFFFSWGAASNAEQAACWDQPMLLLCLLHGTGLG